LQQFPLFFTVFLCGLFPIIQPPCPFPHNKKRLPLININECMFLVCCVLLSIYLYMICPESTQTRESKGSTVEKQGGRVSICLFLSFSRFALSRWCVRSFCMFPRRNTSNIYIYIHMCQRDLFVSCQHILFCSSGANT
jgi:hypothetical protein